MYDIAIIGGGPAGLTAAIYARRANKKCLILEETACGGQVLITDKITNYPAFSSITGLELAKDMEKQATELGAEIEFEKVDNIKPIEGGFKITGEDEQYQARAVIIATGTTPRKLNLPDENKLVGRGISYCATCDGAFYKDKVVAVNGGGYSAAHAALYLANLAKKVYLVHRREEMRAAGDIVEKIKNNHTIELRLGMTIQQLINDGKLTGIVLSDGSTISVDGLFVEIGREPHCDFCPELKLDDDGYVIAGEDCITNIPGIFVAGDIRTKQLRQIVTAASDGAAAAESAIQFLN